MVNPALECSEHLQKMRSIGGRAKISAEGEEYQQKSKDINRIEKEKHQQLNQSINLKKTNDCLLRQSFRYCSSTRYHAVGSASSRSSGIGFPDFSLIPNVPFSMRSSAASTSSRRSDPTL